MTHTCHWPTCNKPVLAKMWGCKEHWFRLPAGYRLKIWKHYRKGQEIDKTPSKEYLAAAREAREWAILYERKNRVEFKEEGK